MKKILCVGTLIADIINQKVERLPSEGECVLSEVSLNLGGNAFSSSVNIRRLAMPNVHVHCYGLIGTDMIGSLFENKLNEEGVISHLSKILEKRTSCNIILQEVGKDRRYIYCEGANSSATKEEILFLVESIKPDIIIFGEIPSLGIVRSDFLELVKSIKENLNALICLDTLINAEEDYNWLNDSWSEIDIVHCNYGEGIHITKESTHTDICSWFIKKGVALSVVSDGDRGCHFGYKNVVEHVPAFKSDEIDATGAGDAMIAGIITKLLELSANSLIDLTGIDLDMVREMIVYGSACGCYAVGSIGCIGDICREKIEHFILKHCHEY